jgi:predicted O-methyltransferase YrrM
MLKRRLQTLLSITISSAAERLAVPNQMVQNECHPRVEEAISYCTGEWVITHDIGRVLASAVTVPRCKNVLEFEVGSSSLVLATALSVAGGGKLTSVEQNPQWCIEKWALVKQKENVDSHMIVAQPRLSIGKIGVYYAFKDAREAIAERGPYDMVVIDSPQYFYGRDGAIPIVYNHLVPNARIILDDAGRGGERWAIFRWLKTYPGLSLDLYDDKFGGKGLAVLRFREGRKPSVSAISVATSIKHTYQRWRALKSGCGISRPKSILPTIP